MKVTLEIPDALFEDARRLVGLKSMNDTVILSLQELLRRRRIEKLMTLRGHIDLHIDLDKSRRRKVRH